MRSSDDTVCRIEGATARRIQAGAHQQNLSVGISGGIDDGLGARIDSEILGIVDYADDGHAVGWE